jgi:hypothetical protein
MTIKRTLMLTCAVAAAAFSAASSASARECKQEVVKAEGEPNVLRDVGAYPSSLFAWRRAVKDKFGGEWNSWRYAEDAKVDCNEITKDGGKVWQCVRTGVPCLDTLNTVIDGAKDTVDIIARECKSDTLTATGARRADEKEAIVQSQWAWRIDVRKKYGKKWGLLDNAKGEDQDCRKVGSKYQCLTTATACLPK